MNKRFYQEPWLSIDEQIDLLRKQGCEVKDADGAKIWLRAVGMSRIEGYLSAFRDEGGRYCEGTNIESVMKICMWDKRLKSIIMDGCRAAELSIRTSIAHVIGEPKRSREGQFAHLEESTYKTKKCFETAIKLIRTNERHARSGSWEGVDPAIRDLGDKYKRCSSQDPCPSCVRMRISRSQSKDAGVACSVFAMEEHKIMCDIPIPVWISIEHWTLETTRAVFCGIDQDSRTRVAKILNLPSSFEVDKLIGAVTQLRNRAAHHARTYDRKLKKPLGGRMRNEGNDVKTFLSVLVVGMRKIPKETRSHKRWEWLLYDHLDRFPKLPRKMSGRAGLAQMGLTKNWKREHPWSEVGRKRMVLFSIIRPLVLRELFDCR